MDIRIRGSIRFLLNDRLVELTTISATETLLDFLRIERRLRGTKEGCAEGDCGACTILVGRLANGQLTYESVNACIRFVGSLDACHVVTVEALAAADGTLHPVQQAMVDTHASQCGFCTPGFVMSLYGLWMHNPNPEVRDIEKALQGNLCRCTGYAAIVRAAESVSARGNANNDPLVAERARVIKQLQALKDGKRVDLGKGKERFVLPANVDDFADIMAANPDATIVAGSTDVGLWVTKFMREIGPVVFTSHLEELRRVTAEDDRLTLGAGVSYTEAYPVISQLFPQLSELWNRIGGEQVRNMGTIGGNVANGSPIGDTPPALIALGADVLLRKGQNRRCVPIEQYFIDYGKQDRMPGEFIEALHIPRLRQGERFAVYKISKRLDEDISSVCGAFKVALDTSGKVQAATIAFGGMAGTPKRAATVEQTLIGCPWNEETIKRAMSVFTTDFTPLTDWRASADYRLLAAKNLLRRFYLETTGEANTRLNRYEAAVG